MGRLIDADHLLFLLNSAIELRKKLHRNTSDLDMMVDAVNNEPTAYDPDKVVEQIEDIKTGANTNCRMNCSNYDWSVGGCQGLCEEYLKKRAIEIVKAGGTDAEH